MSREQLTSRTLLLTIFVTINLTNDTNSQDKHHRRHWADDHHPQHLHWHLQRRRLAQRWGPQDRSDVLPAQVRRDVMWCYHVMSCDALWCHVPWCDPYCIVQTIRLTPSLWTPGPSPPAPPTSSQWRREELTGDRSQCFTGVRSVLKSGPALMRMSQILHFCPDNRLARAEGTKMTLFKGLKF